MFAGQLHDLRPFLLKWTGSKDGASFIAPICLENIDPAVVARMVCGSSSPGKQADFVANISNDGWFATQEKYQHLQTTVFRCIENRVPMVRCSNTGISAFIDSCGRIQRTVAPDTGGFAVRRIELDDRTTFYSRHGDAFAFVCLFLVAAIVVFGAARRAVAQNRVQRAQKRR
jgi:apolipoprotein N-acyltransferase